MEEQSQPLPLAIIICYFGEFPWYFDYFKLSCEYNPTVDFYIVTDIQEVIELSPSNLKLIKMSLEEISVLASNKLSLPITIEKPYKLCDFKPVYGLLFSEILKSYHSWGYGDLDVIYGNIRNFITDELLNSYELISVRPDWIPGCFTIFRNSLKMMHLFSYSADYRKVFTSDANYCFDETNFSHDQFKNGNLYFHVPTEVESMMHVVQKLIKGDLLTAYFDLHIIEGIPGNLSWNKGIFLYRKKYEILLYHLIRFKEKFSQPRRLKLSPTFTISPNRISHQNRSH